MGFVDHIKKILTRYYRHPPGQLNSSLSLFKHNKSPLMAEGPLIPHFQELPSAFCSVPRPPLSHLSPSCGFRILNGKEHIYVPFVHIIYTGQWCHSFYDCVTFFIVYPKTDGALTDTEIYRPSARSGRALEGPADISPAQRRRIKADILLALRPRERGRRVGGAGRKERENKRFCFCTFYFSLNIAVMLKRRFIGYYLETCQW